jgi:sRNA-binding carbon storage regulator CsrA
MAIGDKPTVTLVKLKDFRQYRNGLDAKKDVKIFRRVRSRDRPTRRCRARD